MSGRGGVPALSPYQASGIKKLLGRAEQVRRREINADDPLLTPLEYERLQQLERDELDRRRRGVATKYTEQQFNNFRRLLADETARRRAVNAMVNTEVAAADAADAANAVEAAVNENEAALDEDEGMPADAREEAEVLAELGGTAAPAPAAVASLPAGAPVNAAGNTAAASGVAPQIPAAAAPAAAPANAAGNTAAEPTNGAALAASLLNPSSSRPEASASNGAPAASAAAPAASAAATAAATAPRGRPITNRIRSAASSVSSGVSRAASATASGVSRAASATASGVRRGAQATASGIGTAARATTSGVRRGAQATASGIGRAASATASGVRRGAQATASGIGTAARATSSGVSRAASATASGVSRAASVTASGVSRAVRAVSPVGEAIGRGARSLADKTASAAAAAGTAIVSTMDLGKDGMPIDIMGDRYFLDTRFKGAADINTRAAFDNLYGVSTGDALTITTIYKVFQSPAPMSEKAIIDKINTLSEGELKSLAVAINTRIDTLKRTINSLSRGSVLQSVAKFKLDRMQKLYGWISTTLAARASGVKATAPTSAINYRTHYKALKEDKKDEARKHEYMFDAIMGIAYYLANPDFLLSDDTIDDTARQAIIDKFESVLDLIDKGHLHDLVKSIRADANLPVELKDADAMNYFDRIRLKEVLKEKTDISASGEILRQVKMPTMDEVMSNRVVAMIKLFQAKKYIDASAVAQIEASIRDKDTYTLMGSLGNAIKDVSGGLGAGLNATSKETIRGMYDSFTPVYNFYKRVYDPVFTFLEEKVVGVDPSSFNKWPLADMTRILGVGITKYQRKDASNNFGVYKMLDVSGGVADFIKKLQTASRFTGMEPSLKEAFVKLSARQILDDDITRAFVNFTPNIRYLLYSSQFAISQLEGTEELLEEKISKIKEGATTKPTAKNIAKLRANKAKAAAAAAKAAAAAAAAPAPAGTSSGGGHDDYIALQNFFTENTIYMFVKHKDPKQSSVLNPKLVAADNTISQTSELAHYAKLKQTDLIKEPIGDDLRYVQLNITILAISCMIIFYKRLGEISQ